MTGLDREVRRRRQQSERKPTVAHPPETARCSAGNPPSVCCVGDPWGNPNVGMQVMHWGEPLSPSVIEVAARAGIDPHVLHDHVEGDHGLESHDAGYDDAVANVVECLAPGAECPVAKYVEQAIARFAAGCAREG